jgi:4-diphosphocytidyl-2-C-methyl-D-erythritol kinase
MHSYALLAPAKINLYLEIMGARPDGYHELAMILQSIDLADQIDVRANGTDRLRVRCDDPQVPADESNLAYRAAALMAKQFPEAYNRYGGVDIAIQKRIPMGAGLAGGSADAAAVLVGIDLLWKLGLTQGEIQELAAQLGSDIPFCVTGGTAIATGRGEKLAPLPSPTLCAVLAKYRSLEVSTAWAYKTYRQQFLAPDSDPARTDRPPRERSGTIVDAITKRQGRRIGELLYNDLERVVLPAHARVSELKQLMTQFNPLGAMMSGSGSTVFALVESRADAHQLQQQLRQALPDPDLQLWTTQLIAHGVRLIH